MPAKLSTHVLDLTTGRPAQGMQIQLWLCDETRTLLGDVVTNADGRTDAVLLDEGDMAAGTYELVFQVKAYFARCGVACDFLNEVPIRFAITDSQAAYHVPLLVTPWAYQTYRGS